jgi:NADH:ubiquinone oxidoreductase subunit
MTLATRLYTWLRGESVGADAFGNRYYRDKHGARRFAGRREKRWVVYNGPVEASRVPPEWHAWLHHLVVAPPAPGAPRARPWQREHVANLTGTAEAYRPPGHDFQGGKRARATGDYEAWTPTGSGR